MRAFADGLFDGPVASGGADGAVQFSAAAGCEDLSGVSAGGGLLHGGVSPEFPFGWGSGAGGDGYERHLRGEPSADDGGPDGLRGSDGGAGEDAGDSESVFRQGAGGEFVIQLVENNKNFGDNDIVIVGEWDSENE